MNVSMIACGRPENGNGLSKEVEEEEENKQYILALLLSEHQNILTERCKRIYYLNDNIW